MVKKTEVAILGCGPAGLLAAHAVERAGHTPTIISHKQKSVIPGSQYLHEPIPGLTSVYPENTVQYVRMGTAEGYAAKVYGDPERETGWDNYRALYPSWNVIKAYDLLWDRFESRIVSWTINTRDEVDYISDMWQNVISTLPQPHMCALAEGGHNFSGVPYWIKTLPLPEIDRGHDIVIYNGMPVDPWYRYSILGDRCSIETTFAHEWQEDDSWIAGTKAVSNDCDCWPSIIRAGRWAEWKHGVLLHDAFRKVERAMGDHNWMLQSSGR